MARQQCETCRRYWSYRILVKKKVTGKRKVSERSSPKAVEIDALNLSLQVESKIEVTDWLFPDKDAKLTNGMDLKYFNTFLLTQR